MVKKLVIGSIELIVDNIYAYRYDYGKGKEVLRIEISETSHTFDDIKILVNADNKTIIYYEDDVKKCEYTNYCSDFSSNYINGIFSIEITRLSELEMEVIALKNQLKLNQIAISEVSDIVLNS